MTSPPVDSEGTGDDVIDFLASVPLFAELPHHLLGQIRSRCQSERLVAGDWLFRQDDEGEALFVVRTGRVELIRELPAPEVVLGVAGPGDALGELSLLTSRRRTASARAIRDSELLRLDRAALVEVLAVSPDLAAGLLRTLGQRLRVAGGTRGQRGKRPTILSVVPVDPNVPLDEIGAGLAAAFAHHGAATVFDGTEVDQDTFGRDELVAEWARRLDQLERTNDHVVLVAPDGKAETWRDFCLRQADRVVGVTCADRVQNASALPVGSDLLFWTSRVNIVALDDYLRKVQPRSHHFVDPRRPTEGLARAARRLTGTAIGLVLSGGGARSLASIGVLDELTQSGVSVDRIGGAGLGALVAGMFALGLPPGEMTRRCHDEFVVRHAFRDYTVPRVALLRGRRFSSMLDRVFGDVRVEQLSRPFFCLSADLGTANVVVHRRGRLAAAIAASTALPGVLPPVIDEDRVLFDGSVLDNVPVTVLAEEDEGPVVAVDVRLRPWEGRGRSNRSLPGIVDTISRAAALGGSQNQAESHRRALLVLEPDPPERRQLDFERLDEIVEAGRETVRAALADNPWLVGGGARSE